MDIFALRQIIKRIPPFKFRYLGSFPSDHVPTLDNDTFAIINTQPSNMQGEHWIMIANFRHELYFADSLGCKGYSFLNNQHYKQMMPAPLQSHPSRGINYPRGRWVSKIFFPRKRLTVPKSVAQCRKDPLPYLNTCITYLNASIRLPAPYLNTCIAYLNTLS